MNLSKLKDPFPAADIEWRVQKSGITNGKPWAMVLAYVTNRAIMDRLDEVCGPENWQNDFKDGPKDGLLCGISIKCGDEWVTKWDGADNTNIEAVKGGLSGAMKRAGSQWRIGRYLYNLDGGWAEFADNGRYSSEIPTKSGKYYKWNPPALPKWALPEGEAPKTTPKPKPKPAATEPDNPEGLATDAQVKKINVMISTELLERVEVKRLLKVASLKDLTKDRASNLIEKWDDFVEVYNNANGPAAQ